MTAMTLTKGWKIVQAPPDHARDANDRAFLKQTSEALLGKDGAQFCDVTIRTSDNKEILACRALLGIRSEYFKKLFFSKFKEGNSDEVEIGITAKMLRIILEYAYSGHSNLTDRFQEAVSKPDLSLVSFPEMSYLVDVLVAADYCGMDALSKTCNDIIASFTNIASHGACLFMDAMYRHQKPDLFTAAKCAVEATVCDDPRNSFEVSDCVRSQQGCQYRGKKGEHFGVLKLSAAALDEVLQWPFSPHNQEYLFQVIYFWGTNGEELKKAKTKVEPSRDDKEGGSDGDSDGCSPEGERWTQAKQLVRHLKLTEMRAPFLRDYVKPSGLVEFETLFDVFCEIASRGVPPLIEV